MSETLCDLSQDLERDLNTYVMLVYQPRFVCAHCGRAANKKKNLCHPKRIQLVANMDKDEAE